GRIGVVLFPGTGTASECHSRNTTGPCHAGEHTDSFHVISFVCAGGIVRPLCAVQNTSLPWLPAESSISQSGRSQSSGSSAAADALCRRFTRRCLGGLLIAADRWSYCKAV